MADFAIEEGLRARGFRCLAGVDEAGRGPLAGPVVAAAVILPARWESPVALDDSKRLAPQAREQAFAAIKRFALAWSLAVVPAREIDRVNILKATLAAMARAVGRLRLEPDFVLVDGNRLPELRYAAQAVVKGDARSLSIAAASIVAKVARDRIMVTYARRYPHWGFERHKGYGTAAHLEALHRWGHSPIHRRSFHLRRNG